MLNSMFPATKEYDMSVFRAESNIQIGLGQVGNKAIRPEHTIRSIM